MTAGVVVSTAVVVVVAVVVDVSLLAMSASDHMRGFGALLCGGSRPPPVAGGDTDANRWCGGAADDGW